MKKFTKIIFSCLLVMVLMFVSGCLHKEPEPRSESTVIQDKEKIEENQNDEKSISTSSNNLENVEENSAIDTSNWLTYKHEEYDFEFKYPDGWYWEDYTEEFAIGRPVVGFYPANKKKDWEYFGDFYIEVLENKDKLGIANFFKKEYKDKPFLFDGLIVDTTQNGYKYAQRIDVPGNVDVDVVFIQCNEKIISFSTPFGIFRKSLDEVINTFECK